MEKNKQYKYIGKEIEIDMPHYSKRGILIEFPKFDITFWKFISLRILGFIIDFLIPGTIQFLLWSIFRRGVIISGLATLMYYHAYYFTTMLILKNRTIGSALCNQVVVHKSGFITSVGNIYLRALIMSVYALPYIGWGFMFINFMSLFLMRGITLFDLISSTLIISKKQFEILDYIERSERNV